MPKLPSADYSRDEIAAILTAFGSLENFLQEQSDWLYSRVIVIEQEEVMREKKREIKRKFPKLDRDSNLSAPAGINVNDFPTGPSTLTVEDAPDVPNPPDVPPA